MLQGKPQNQFMQIAVSNWPLYCSSQISDSNCNGSFGKKNALEAYTDFWAGIAVGDKKYLRENKKPDIIIVREKQLSESEYVALFTRLCEKVEHDQKQGAEQAKADAHKSDTALLIPHTYPAAARSTGSEWLHLPFALFERYQTGGLLSGLRIGTSVHSVAEARRAQQLGAVYVTAGHIFATDCKKGVPARGLEFLQTICESVCIPVYAIGGIHQENMAQVLQTRAAGACCMSEYIRWV